MLVLFPTEVRRFYRLILLIFDKHVSEDLWRQLKRLGLNETDENPPVLGNNKQALELLVQQRLLVLSGCAAECVFHWQLLFFSLGIFAQVLAEGEDCWSRRPFI